MSDPWMDLAIRDINRQSPDNPAPRTRHDPWGDLMRNKKLPYMPYAGLDEAMARRLPIAAGIPAITSAPKYGISPKLAASQDPMHQQFIYGHLSNIQYTYNHGIESLLNIASDNWDSNDLGIHHSFLRAAGFQAAQLGEPIVAAQFFKVASLIELGEDARTDAAKAFWIAEFKSSLGSGEAKFAAAADALLLELSEINTETVDQDRRAIRKKLMTALSPGAPQSIVSMLQPDALDGLIKYLEADKSPMLPAVQTVNNYIKQVKNHDLPENYRDLERWKAEVQGDIEEIANIAYVQIEGIPATALFSWKRPTRNIPISPLRHITQSARRWTKGAEAAMAVLPAYSTGLSKVLAAASAADIDMDERARLLREAYERFQEPWTTIIGGDKPAQTWNELFGKKAESVDLYGELFEKAGKKLQESTDRNHQTIGYAAERWGRLIRDNKEAISPLAETAVTFAPSLFLQGPGAATQLGQAARSIPGAVATNNVLQTAPLLGSTPESLYPMLAVLGLKGAAGMRIPRRVPVVGGVGLPVNVNPHTGELVTWNALNPRVLGRPIDQINKVLGPLNPVPVTTGEFYGMHKLGAGQYEAPRPPDEDQNF